MSIYDPHCTLCPLFVNAQTVCMPASIGKRLSHAMIVGEAPGVNEDVTGSPFMGRAGSVLTAAIRAAGVTREDVTITNAVKCRPVNNRMPKDIEIDTCHRYLDREIEEYRITCILALGNAALYSLLGVTGVTSMRGEWYGDVFPTYHPAYVARQRTDSEVSQEFREDVKEFLEHAIDTHH